MFGYGLFLLCSTILSLILDFTVDEFYKNKKAATSWNIIFLGFITSILIILFLVLFTYLFFIKNSKETIYIKHVHYKSPGLPFAQLILSILNTFLIVKTTYSIIMLFCIQFVTYLSCLLVTYKLVRFFRFKSHDINNNGLFEAKNEIFTINTQKNSQKMPQNNHLDSSARNLNKVDTISIGNDAYASTSSNLHLIS